MATRYSFEGEGARIQLNHVVEFSKVEFLERAKVERWDMCSLRSVGEQDDG
jgi:hypothetical protein